MNPQITAERYRRKNPQLFYLNFYYSQLASHKPPHCLRFPLTSFAGDFLLAALPSAYPDVSSRAATCAAPFADRTLIRLSARGVLCRIIRWQPAPTPANLAPVPHPNSHTDSLGPLKSRPCPP